jgi:maltose alpha-D-glucosyltransferase/alpha-amylase
MERVIRLRKECPELGFGAWRLLDAGDPAVLAHRCDWDGGSVVAVHNLSAEPKVARLGLEAAEPLLSDRDPKDGEGPRLELDGHGYRWFRLP